MRIDHRARSGRNMLAASTLDRVHARRGDEAWIAERLRDSQTAVTLLWRSKHLVAGGPSPRPVAIPPNRLESLGVPGAPLLLLGLAGERAWFAAVLPPDVDPPPGIAALGEFRDLRELAPLLSADEASLLAQARGLVHWHGRHGFCADCGAPTRPAQSGHVRVCTAPACGKEHFPRTDPAVIVLVTSRGRCLLGRQPAWPKGRYSVVAGFVEPGESLEEAVAREVEEETGIVVGAVRYHSSQPWPFPASLMLGFTAEALSDTIRLDDELEDAAWFSRRELRVAIEEGRIRVPSPISISYRLIESWYDRGGERLERLVEPGW